MHLHTVSTRRAGVSEQYAQTTQCCYEPVWTPSRAAGGRTAGPCLGGGDSATDVSSAGTARHSVSHGSCLVASTIASYIYHHLIVVQNYTRVPWIHRAPCTHERRMAGRGRAVQVCVRVIQSKMVDVAARGLITLDPAAHVPRPASGKSARAERVPKSYYLVRVRR